MNKAELEILNRLREVIKQGYEAFGAVGDTEKQAEFAILGQQLERLGDDALGLTDTPLEQDPADDDSSDPMNRTMPRL